MGISQNTNKVTATQRKALEVSLQLSQSTKEDKVNYFCTPSFFEVLHKRISGYEHLIQNALTLLNLVKISEMQEIIEFSIQKVEEICQIWKQTSLGEDLLFVLKIYKKLYDSQIKCLYQLTNERKLELIKAVKYIEIFQIEGLKLAIELLVISINLQSLIKEKKWFCNKKYYEVRYDAINELYMNIAHNNLSLEYQLEINLHLKTPHLKLLAEMIYALSSLYLMYNFQNECSIPIQFSQVPLGLANFQLSTDDVDNLPSITSEFLLSDQELKKQIQLHIMKTNKKEEKQQQQHQQQTE